MATPAQLTALLADAQKAYHSLQTGVQARVVVEMDGTRVEFAPANSARLYSYIQTLQAQLNIASATPLTGIGPATFVF